MKLIRSVYPDIPGVKGSPCWTLTAGRLWADADWNTRYPFGTSLCIRLRSRGSTLPDGPGFTLDINAPLGEPNRLYLWLGRWHAIFGLPTVQDYRDTGRTEAFNGREIPVYEHFSNWRRPRIAGCDRYQYHKDNDGNWVRNDKPEPMHWGWLTITRREIK